MNNVLVLEPFYGGSHKEMIDLFMSEFKTIDLFSLPAKKWHWRASTSALHFSKVIPLGNCYTKLFCSSVLNLTELIGLRPDLAHLEKTIYTHENQLVYPVLEKKNRDFHFGYTQILSCLTANRILFNSLYNMKSFLDNIDQFLKLIPSDCRPKNLSDEISPKCQVLYFPMVYPDLNNTDVKKPQVLHIVWNHRWEHDKKPELFFETLFKLINNGYKFHLSVLGESYEEKPSIFEEAKEKLMEEIVNWGFLPTKSDYYMALQTCHVAVSTAKQECFGISILEATYCGCFPICPNELSYPEIYPKDCLYSTESQLYKILKNFCKFPMLAVQKRQKLNIDYNKYDWKTLRDSYAKFLT